MKKMMTMFALTAASAFAGCDGNKAAGPLILTLDDSPLGQQSVTPCVVEVENFHSAELDAIDASDQRKFYNFCDSTVTILYWQGTGDGGPGGWQRPLTDVHGTEKAEMDNLYKKYQAKLGLNK